MGLRPAHPWCLGIRIKTSHAELSLSTCWLAVDGGHRTRSHGAHGRPWSPIRSSSLVTNRSRTPTPGIHRTPSEAPVHRIGHTRALDAVCKSGCCGGVCQPRSKTFLCLTSPQPRRMRTTAPSPAPPPRARWTILHTYLRWPTIRTTLTTAKCSFSALVGETHSRHRVLRRRHC